MTVVVCVAAAEPTVPSNWHSGAAAAAVLPGSGEHNVA